MVADPGSTPSRSPNARQLYDTGERTVQQIADLLSVPRTTIYGHLDPDSKGKRPTAERCSEQAGRCRNELTLPGDGRDLSPNGGW